MSDNRLGRPHLFVMDDPGNVKTRLIAAILADKRLDTINTLDNGYRLNNALVWAVIDDHRAKLVKQHG